MKEIAVAELRVGDHVELGEQSYDVHDVVPRPGVVEVIDTCGAVHIYATVAFVAVR
jgi:hypothetical protein